MRYCEKAIELEPDLPTAYGAHVNLGRIYQRRKEFKKALREYQVAYDLRPSNRLLFAMGNIKYRYVISVFFLLITALGIFFKSVLLVFPFFLLVFAGMAMTSINFFRQKKIFWGVIDVLGLLLYGWILYILIVWFSK